MSLSPDAARGIVESGALAPSGDNLQPWLLTWQGDTLQVRIDTTRDQSLYNFKYRPSHIALGAMIENMIIAARQYGYEAEVGLSAGPNATLSASLTFAPSSVRADPLFPSIKSRCTNRKPYSRRPITSEQLQRLRDASPEGAATVQFIEAEREKRLVAGAAALNDRLLFELRPLHDRFFESIRWTEAEAERSRDGLYVKTLELGPMSAVFKLFRSWSVVNMLNRIGSSVMAPDHSRRTFVKSAAFGFLQMHDTSLESYVRGGRLMQRLWLTATSMGLSFQPMAGMLYLLQYLDASEGSVFNPAQRRILTRADQQFRQVLPLDNSKAAIMLFRIGYGPPPSATSLRRRL